MAGRCTEHGFLGENVDGRREVKEQSSRTFSDGSRLDVPGVYDRLGDARNMVFWAKTWMDVVN